MKELSQKEFEEQIQRLIDGQTTRKKLAKEIGTDIRTLNKKIMEMSAKNPELYTEFIKEFPYKPKEIEVDIEELAIYCITHDNKMAAERFNMSTRTITRKLKRLAQINPELNELYLRKAETEGSKTSHRDREKYFINLTRIAERIGKRDYIDNAERKRTELEQTISAFEDLLAQGMSKAKAARTLGYDGYPTIWKKYNELERIKTEEKYGKKGSSFRESMKVDSSNLSQKSEQKHVAKEQRIRDNMQK